MPHHGGTPSEMLRDLADFLDKLDDAGSMLVINHPGHKRDGETLHDILNPNVDGERPRTMQADVRWLADALDQQNGSPTKEEA